MEKIMDENKVVITQREQFYIERYIDGEINKMLKQLKLINEKYDKIEDIYTGYVKSFFSDNMTEMLKYKKIIKKFMKK